jgi:hypothetical protein
MDVAERLHGIAVPLAAPWRNRLQSGQARLQTQVSSAAGTGPERALSLVYYFILLYLTTTIQLLNYVQSIGDLRV